MLATLDEVRVAQSVRALVEYLPQDVGFLTDEPEVL